MHRFIIDPSWKEEGSIRLQAAEFKHFAQVLRGRVGMEIACIDGSGDEYLTRVKSVEKTFALLEILIVSTPQVETISEITLLQGIPKLDKMDFIVQKAVEMGVSRIVPVQTAFVVKKETDDLDTRVTRWNRIAREAVKQSGRTRIPAVMSPMKLNDAIQAHPGDLGLFFYERETKKDLKDTLKWYTMKQHHRLSVLIGAEGGFHADEAALLEESGFTSVSLGKRILRTETVSIAALAMILYELGEYS